MRALVFALVLLTTPLAAQEPVPGDTLRLPEVEVQATRSAGGLATAPFSIAVAERTAPERLADTGTALTAALARLPGLFVADRQNAALGERLSVRGLGYRARFGVRGVQVVLDGIPLTLADGQAVLGIADPALIRQAELVRGPASALWGNGSGGVLFLRTLPDAPRPSAEVHAAGGAYGLVRLAARADTRWGRHRTGIAVSRTRRDGYRAHSAFETTRARAYGTVALAPATALQLVGAVEHAPRLEHPGTLTAAELAADPRQAEARYVDTASGKASTQAQAGATLRTRTAAGDVTATVYGLTRTLDNPLPFAYITVDRRAGGTRLALERTLGPVRATLGADAAFQHDDRTNRPNEAGSPGTERTLDQIETVTQGALFGRLRLDLGPLGLPGAAAEAALRGDRLRFDAEDRLRADGDDSGTRTLGAVSPLLGVSLRRGPVLIFGSYATAFETPTTTELVNRPDGSGGFNPDLRPQHTRGVEVGARGVVGAFLFDAAAYALTVRDGLTPFEDATGRTYYANRGRTTHRGAELFTEWRPHQALAAGLTYTLARLRFAEDPDGPTEVDGNALPGVPEHRLAARLQLTRGRFFVAPDVTAQSGVFADDANTVRTDALVVADLAVGFTDLDAGPVRLAAFARLGNAFGATGAGSVAINGFGGRYFEPVAGRHVEAGVTVTY